MRTMIMMLLLSGCSLLPGGTTTSLDGEWLLQAGTNEGVAIPMVAGSAVTFQVDGAQVGGSAACNSYGGKIEVSGSSIVVSELIQTEMACLDNRLMALESAYLDALPRVTTAARSGSSLLLTGPQVELRFTLIPQVANANLVGTPWILESLIRGDVVSSTVGERVTLQLSGDGRLAASTGCRNVTGSYTVAGGQLQVTLDAYDTIGCAAELGDQDSHILDVLSHGFGVSIDGDRLALTAGDKGIGYRADR
ncbi:MAG: META domain-containing protein [Chloroflexota bacterium]